MFVFGTADDVFAMAVRIEENGHAFYAGAAEMTEEPQAKELFEELARMEEGHVLAFKALRGLLPGSGSEPVWDPEGLAESYLQATADTHIFTQEAAQTRLAAVKTPSEALDMALQFEKDSIAFFIGMKEILPDVEGRGKIDALINQEMDHYRMITAAKKRLELGGKPTIA
jgi:rubrerythrin